MNFIESWLHVSPDGGNGTFEVACVAAALTLVLAFAFRRSLRRLVATRRGLPQPPLPRE